MTFLARILNSFDEALDWPDDLFLADEQPVEDWAEMPVTRSTTTLRRTA